VYDLSHQTSTLYGLAVHCPRPCCETAGNPTVIHKRAPPVSIGRLAILLSWCLRWAARLQVSTSDSLTCYLRWNPNPPGLQFRNILRRHPLRMTSDAFPSISALLQHCPVLSRGVTPSVFRVCWPLPPSDFLNTANWPSSATGKRPSTVDPRTLESCAEPAVMKGDC
jgi:hypothetical protein